MGDEIEAQNVIISELGQAIDNTAGTIQRDRETLQRHAKKHKIAHCGAYLFFTILILVVVIIILNILRNAFRCLFLFNKQITPHQNSRFIPHQNTHSTSKAIKAAPMEEPSSARPISMSFLPSSSNASFTHPW